MMKIKTATKIILGVFSFTIFFASALFAQSYVPVDTSDVTVNANITIDLYTQLTLIPTTVEIKEPTTVSIISVNSEGVPRAGREIVLYIDGDSTGVTIGQPALTDVFGETTGSVSAVNPGTYIVCAKDITEGYDIQISDCETLYVVPVSPPNMVAEPQYTQGDSNIVMWNMSVSGIYQYYAETSINSGFNSIYANSGWTSNLAHEFQSLQNGKMYFYRVKTRNTYGGESTWSNTVFSVQDSSNPVVELISISDAGENNTTEWEKTDSVDIKYKINDNIGISSKEFWCVSEDGSRYDCDYTSSINGDFWNISVSLDELETKSKGKLFNSYQFCVEAVDLVGNVTRNCEAVLEIPEKETEGEVPIPGEEEKPSVGFIDQVQQVIEDLVDNTIGRLEETELENVIVTTTVVNIAVGLGFLLSLLGNIPYIVMQLILATSSLLGLRKKGNVAGYVYDSLTKEPVSQAVVRIFNESNELVWTDVTDSNGYFRTIDLEDAEYYIKVSARGYIFPSRLIFGKTDFPLKNVYHGDPFLTKNQKVPDFSIPIDKKETSVIKKVLIQVFSRIKIIWRVLYILLLMFGFLFSVYAFTVKNVWWNYLIVFIYLVSFLVFLLFLFSRRSKYGVVKDQKNNIVEGIIVGLTEKEFEKLVSKRVSDNLGRYKFIVNPGIYDLSIMNPDYKIINEGDLQGLEIEKKGGVLLCPDIIVKKLEDDTKEKVEKPLEEL